LQNRKEPITLRVSLIP